MGNRAVITTKNDLENDGIGVYLHWNGGIESVAAFLKYCKLKGYRSPECDDYGWACLCKVIGNYFADGLSLGIDKVKCLDCDNWDNGTYFIEDWEIVGRKFTHYRDYDYDKTIAESEVYEHEEEIKDMIIDINNSQPEKQKIYNIAERLKEVM